MWDGERQKRAVVQSTMRSRRAWGVPDGSRAVRNSKIGREAQFNQRSFSAFPRSGHPRLRAHPQPNLNAPWFAALVARRAKLFLRRHCRQLVSLTRSLPGMTTQSAGACGCGVWHVVERAVSPDRPEDAGKPTGKGGNGNALPSTFGDAERPRLKRVFSFEPKDVPCSLHE